MTTSPITPNRAARRSNARRAGTVGAGALLVTGGAAALIAGLAGSAGASTTITVDSNADGAADATHCTDGTPGNCTLRDAAAAALDGDTIVFDPSVTSITLTNNTVDFQAINLTGPSSSALTITTTAAAGSYDIFYFLGSGTGDVVISGLTVTKNSIYAQNTGKLTVDDVSVTGSTADYGGALYAGNTGDLEITNSYFDSNTSSDSGGAIYAYNTGNVIITDSTFTNNETPYYGTVFASSNTVDFTMTNCTVTGNMSDQGGGIYLNGSGDASVSDSNISNNTADTGGGGGYINNFGSFTMSGTTIEGNVSPWVGGGFYFGGEVEAITITSSNISNNSAVYGGGISVAGPDAVLIANTTMTGNVASSNGGALYLANPLTPVELDQDTISGNTARYGGGVVAKGSTVTLSGTIVSANTASVDPTTADIAAPVNGATVNSSFSLVGAVGSSITFTDNGGTVMSSTPGLLALADNGGATKTMALDPTSAALDTGPDPVATFTGNGFDQRGTPWVRVYNGTADIGAYEEQPDPTPTTTTTTTEPTTTTTEPTTTTAGTDPVAPAFTG